MYIVLAYNVKVIACKLKIVNEIKNIVQSTKHC